MCADGARMGAGAAAADDTRGAGRAVAGTARMGAGAAAADDTRGAGRAVAGTVTQLRSATGDGAAMLVCP
jgi:hypothetical protein